MNIVHYCQKIITYSFYALFALVPIIFDGSTSELFEFNKMWLAYGITLIIAVTWGTKMIAEKQIRVQRTPLDILLVLFLVSQIISTIFSLDSWVSFWGYYSRFNGGLLSMLTYVFLYFAFVTNSTRQHTVRLLYVILASGLFVALWGLPSHFGKDPTCLVFRGTLDASCWTEAFRPTVRIFSTLGQPAWLSAFLAVLLPVTLAFASQKLPSLRKKDAEQINPFFIGYSILAILFYICLLYTNTRAGFAGFWVANGVFWLTVFIKKIFPQREFAVYFVLCNAAFIILNFFLSTPFSQLNFLTLQKLTAKQAPVAQPTQQAQQQNAQTQPETLNITDSGDIRKHVWKGAVDAWKANPVFGTGVETFAFAYYKHRPPEHNLTSEWDYLYNKAHNEFLNYLTTTGIVGLGTYLAFIGFFLFLTAKYILKKHTAEENQTILLVAALTAGFISILITNFLGFSVVIMNLFLFLIPAFVMLLNNTIGEKELAFPKQQQKVSDISLSQWAGVAVLSLIGLWGMYSLFAYWQADKAYALGSNLSRAGEIQQAYPLLQKAVDMKPSEPIYKDEFSMVSAQVAQGFFAQQQATEAAKFAQQAIELNSDVLTRHPNNLVFWKTRIRILYTLGQLDEQYLVYALQAAEKAVELAPTDAKVMYNLGVLYGQTGNPQKAVDILNKTVALKPDYQDAYFALGLFYRDLAIDTNGTVINPEMQTKAEKTMQQVLQMNPENEQAKSTLAEWQK